MHTTDRTVNCVGIFDPLLKGINPAQHTYQVTLAESFIPAITHVRLPDVVHEYLYMCQSWGFSWTTMLASCTSPWAVQDWRTADES